MIIVQRKHARRAPASCVHTYTSMETWRALVRPLTRPHRPLQKAPLTDRPSPTKSNRYVRYIGKIFLRLAAVSALDTAEEFASELSSRGAPEALAHASAARCRHAAPELCIATSVNRFTQTCPLADSQGRILPYSCQVCHFRFPEISIR